MKKEKTFYQVIFYDDVDMKKRNIIDTEYYFDEPTDEEIDELGKSLGAKFCECYYDKYENDEYNGFEFDKIIN